MTGEIFGPQESISLTVIMIFQFFIFYRDILHQQLDDQTIRLEDFKKRLLVAENKRVDVEQENSGQLRRVKDCLSEINELQQKIKVRLKANPS